MNYSRDDIASSLKKIKIKKSENIFLSTSFFSLGLAENNLSIKELNECFFNEILKLIGPKGSIFVPTYSYSFSDNNNSLKVNKFNKKTPSKIGNFTNFFLTKKKIFRNKDPMISIAGIGPLAKKILCQNQSSSYGADSVFSKLIGKNVKILNIGLGFNWMPFLHYLDFLNNSEWRYEKLFYGQIENEKKFWTYNVRVLEDESMATSERIGKLAYKNKLWTKIKLGRSHIFSASYDSLLKFAKHKTKKNPWLLCLGPKKNFIAKIYSKNLKFINDSKHRIKNINRQPRLISTDNAVFYNTLSNKFNFKILKYKTGQTDSSWVVPEKYIVNEFYISYRNKKIINNKNAFLMNNSKSIDLYLSGKEIKSKLFCNSKNKLDYLNLKKSPKIENFTNINLKDKYFYNVKVDSSFEFGYLLHLEKKFKKKIKKVRLIVLELNNVYNEEISNFLSKVFGFLKYQNSYQYKFLIVPDRRFVHFSIDENEIQKISKIFYFNLKKNNVLKKFLSDGVYPYFKVDKIKLLNKKKLIQINVFDRFKLFNKKYIVSLFN